MDKLPLPDLATQQMIADMGKRLEALQDATTPNVSRYNPDPDYLRELLDRAAVSQRKAAKLIGVSERTMRDYLNSSHSSEAPYPVQFALECLAINAQG